LRPLIELLADPEFKRMVETLPGYDVAQMGKIVAELH
jgi:hypothetical protein